MTARIRADEFFDDCDATFSETPFSTLWDATDILAGYHSQVRAAACAFAEAYASHVAGQEGKPENS
jgi:hypothetical protein